MSENWSPYGKQSTLKKYGPAAVDSAGIVTLGRGQRAGLSSIAGKRYHFIGAGGIGLSGLVGIMVKDRAIATGSDRENSPVIASLSRAGIDIKIGHNRENISDNLDGVVISAAIKEDNPELIAARKKNIPVYKYARMLGNIMSQYDGVAVAGTHGKSTTSGWLTFVMQRAGFEPNFIVGAEISQLGSSCGRGDSRIFIAEACEYDRSFLNLRPKTGVILNIEQDHLDYYKNENEIVEAFGCFAGGIREDGLLIANGCVIKMSLRLSLLRLAAGELRHLDLAPAVVFPLVISR
ncbi:MAG: hypothetical protein GWO86_04225 [Planctomycetes bacterium]|nr:hypothetical protein [Planctomycetota bacterium]